MAVTVSAAVAGEARRPNVLLICVDDLRPELGCYGCGHIQTPHIDRLGREGRIFERHYVQVAICVPSRQALLSGIRDGGGAAWVAGRKSGAEPERPVSIAHLFRRHGYWTICIGKVSHQPGGVIGREAQQHEVPFSWDVARGPTGKWGSPWGAFFGYADGSVREYGYGEDDRTRPAYEMADVPDTGYADGLIADEAVGQLRELEARGQPFFLAVGFYKPHLPFNSPKRYWDLYDREEIPMATNPVPPEGSDPSFCLHPSYEVTTHYGWPEGPGKIGPENARTLRHAYFACVSYTDAQVGKVLDALRDSGLERKTVVVLWGDHGWHLGDHGMFGKDTNYEVATRSPLIIRTPGLARPGEPTRALAETVDLYPTLADLCGIPCPEGLPGDSLVPVIQEPGAPGQPWAMSHLPTRAKQNVIGYTLRDDRYRIVEWRRRDSRQQVLVELYDHEHDPEENRSVAADRPDVVERMLGVLGPIVDGLVRENDATIK